MSKIRSLSIHDLKNEIESFEPKKFPRLTEEQKSLVIIAMKKGMGRVKIKKLFAKYNIRVSEYYINAIRDDLLQQNKQIREKK